MKKLLCFLALSLMGTQFAHADTPSTHGMLLFGENAFYASHLPMFHAPHDYQVILKLKLNDSAESSAVKKYSEAKIGGETLFTLVPEVMDLSKIVSGEKNSFKAIVFQGHFERGGQSLGSVQVEVEKIIFAEKLQPLAPPQNVAKYLVFGADGEYFAAHVIGAKPSFDAVYEVGQPFKFVNSFCGRGHCPMPEKVAVPDSELPLILPLMLLKQVLTPAIGEHLGFLRGVQTKVQSQIYFEEDELAN